MTDSPKSRFVYVTFIRTTQERLWTALTDPEFTKQYWFGAQMESDWKAGSAWRMVFPDGRITDAGEVIQADPPRLLVLKWLHQLKDELKAEGYSRCTMELEPFNGAIKLTITHEMDRPQSKTIEAVSGGWPRILSNLKSLLETGAVAMESKAGCGG